MIGKKTQAWLDENPVNRYYENGAIYTLIEDRNGTIERYLVIMGHDRIHKGFLNGWQSEEDKDIERRIEEADVFIDHYQQIGYSEVFDEVRSIPFDNHRYERVP